MVDIRGACPHLEFDGVITVNRLEDTGLFSADVTVHCADCSEPFRFIGLQSGISFEHPMASIDGLELRAPIEPEGEKAFARRSVFQVPQPALLPLLRAVLACLQPPFDAERNAAVQARVMAAIRDAEGEA